MDHLYAVVMAGGKGERFWPMGRSAAPKQLLALDGDRTMLENTVQRLFPLVAADHILVITARKFVPAVQALLPVPAENIIGEPEGRDTAPCVALAAALILRRDPEAVMILLPADHVVRPVKQFQQALSAAVLQARSGALVTLGIAPSYPATGYGYIHAGQEVSAGFRRVLEFREKPPQDQAEAYLKDGSYFWNSGIFVWRADVIARAFRLYVPELADRMDGWIAGKDFQEDFASCPKISIDYAVMEKAENVLVGRVDFYWNDLGSWSSLLSVLPLDDQGNAVRGKVIAQDSDGNVLITDDGTLLGVIGMHKVAVIKSGNGILVCPLEQEQQVKQLVHRIWETGEEFL